MSQKTLSTAILMIVINLFSISTFSQSRITSIQAKLFYNEQKDTINVSGTFSENIIDNPDITLYNVAIGEGSAKGYSNQTVVIVEVTAKNQSTINHILKLTATTGKKIEQQQKSFFCVNNKSIYKILFLIDNSCSTINLKAEIIEGNKVISVLKKPINFDCAE